MELVLRRLPALAGAVAFAIGVVNLVSALTPNIAWRGHLLLQVMPVRAVPLFHSVAVPASVALIVCSFYLRRRRRRAWAVAIGLLVGLGALDLAKGLDFEEALLSWTGAALLWRGRGTFSVEHGRFRDLRVPAAAVALSAASVLLLVWVASGRGDDGFVLHQTVALFSFTDGAMAFRDELGWVPGFVGALTLALIVVGGWFFFRPRCASRALPDERARRRAWELVHTHGTDTLAFFKLRHDLQYLFARDRRAFLGYRIENGVLLVAGDPVGAVDAVDELVRDACGFAEVHGLGITAIGASERLVPLWREAGLHAVYIGDEAIVETATFSLEGRAIRKVRQSVSRLEKAGYSARLQTVAELDEEGKAELEHVSSLWLDGSPERGFVMTMDALGDGVVVVGRDEEGTARGYLHFVPTHGRAAVSLSLMRRDRATPNGLMEFLVVRAIELLRERGIDELSLNFVMFGHLMERPVLRRLIGFGSRWFQMESLYRFTVKFSPRWEPRFFVFDGLLGLPRAGLAALSAEGQLPRLRAQLSASSAMPAATSTAPARRAGPTRSRRTTAARAAAMTTPVSRTAETDGADARRSASSTSK
jgi:lysyl-tRNA synthetase, class II